MYLQENITVGTSQVGFAIGWNSVLQSIISSLTRQPDFQSQQPPSSSLIFPGGAVGRHSLLYDHRMASTLPKTLANSLGLWLCQRHWFLKEISVAVLPQAAGMIPHPCTRAGNWENILSDMLSCGKHRSLALNFDTIMLNLQLLLRLIPGLGRHIWEVWCDEANRQSTGNPGSRGTARACSPTSLLYDYPTLNETKRQILTFSK